MNKSKLYHLSHIDLDGYACQLVTQEASESEPLFFNCNYGEILNTVEPIFESITAMDMFLITDLNLTAEEASIIDSKQKQIGFNLILLDHHITGEQQSIDYPWYNLDTTISAAKLTFNTLVFDKFAFNKLGLIIDLVDTYDMWRKEIQPDFNRATLLSNLIYNYKLDSQYDTEFKLAIIKQVGGILLSRITGIVEEEVPQILTNILYELAETESMQNLMLDNELCLAVKMSIFPAEELKPITVCYTLNKTGSVFLFEDIQSKTAQYSFDYFLTIKPTHETNNVYIKYDKKHGTVMIRSSNETAVEYAKLLGGGVHGNAAGAKLDINKFPDATSIADFISKQH